MGDTSGIDLDSQTATFIESFGLLISDQGLPRSVGRLLGLMLICEPNYESSEDIQYKLKLSTGAVSLATNTLKNMGLIKLVTFPGDRKFYYQLDNDCWERLVQTRIEQIRRGILIADEGLRILKDDPRLLGMRNLYAMFESALSNASQNATGPLTD